MNNKFFLLDIEHIKDSAVGWLVEIIEHKYTSRLLFENRYIMMTFN